MRYRLWVTAAVAIGTMAQAQNAVELELKYRMCNRHSIPEDKCTDEIYRQLLDSETRYRAAQEAKRKAELSKYRRAEKARLEKEWSERAAKFNDTVKRAVEGGLPALLAVACPQEEITIYKDASKEIAIPRYSPKESPELAPCTDKEQEAIESARPQVEAKALANKRRQFRSEMVEDETFQQVLITNCAKQSYLDQDADNQLRCSVLQDFLKEKH